ncbi:MAG: hypothetical protein JSS50_02710 [Proteobacteria bacterium]|nr:hypothetical protein [Pseudomonadota bacterium]
MKAISEDGIKKQLNEVLGYGYEETTNFEPLHKQIDAELKKQPASTIPKWLLNLHKIRLIAADIVFDYAVSKQWNLGEKRKLELAKDVKQKGQRLAALMLEYEKDNKITVENAAKSEEEQIKLYLASRQLLVNELQPALVDYGIVLPGSVSFPSYRQTNEYLENIVEKAQRKISKNVGSKEAQLGKLTNMHAILSCISKENGISSDALVNGFREVWLYNKVNKFYTWNYHKQNENYIQQLMQEYNEIANKLNTADNKKKLEQIYKSRELSSQQQDQVFQLMVIEWKIQIYREINPKKKAYNKSMLQFLEILSELPESGRNARVVICKRLATIGFAILSLAIPAAAAAVDLLAHGTLQEAIKKAVEQNSLDICNERLLEAINQVMPEFLTVVTVCGILGMTGVLAAAVWRDNSPVRAIGDTETLRKGLIELEQAFIKAYKKEQDEAQSKAKDKSN